MAQIRSSRLRGVAFALGVVLAIPALASSRAAETGTVAYPNNPSGTPATNDGGKPVAPAGAVCAHTGCPDVPKAPPGNASNYTGKDQNAGIRTPATAYPGSPVETPATAESGKAPK